MSHLNRSPLQDASNFKKLMTSGFDPMAALAHELSPGQDRHLARPTSLSDVLMSPGELAHSLRHSNHKAKRQSRLSQLFGLGPKVTVTREVCKLDIFTYFLTHNLIGVH